MQICLIQWWTLQCQNDISYSCADNVLSQVEGQAGRRARSANLVLCEKPFSFCWYFAKKDGRIELFQISFIPHKELVCTRIWFIAVTTVKCEGILFEGSHQWPLNLKSFSNTLCNPNTFCHFHLPFELCHLHIICKLCNYMFVGDGKKTLALCWRSIRAVRTSEVSKVGKPWQYI